ncbi:Cupredoxin [Gorgonomyces haynaldii]|nr:Cupredoxin [Gorgonomyces haynaldii]
MLFFAISAVQAATYNVTISGLTFNPATLNIVAGDVVIWNFAAAQHTVTQTATSNAGDCTKMANGFDSGRMVAPNSFKQTFTTPGKYNYVCSIAAHCAAGMRGSILVSQAGATTGTGTGAAGAGVTHTMQVAPSGALAFAMPTMSVNVGDSITWMFAGKPHTVTQTATNNNGDCAKMTGGFDSGQLTAPAVFTQKFSQIGDVFYVCFIAAHCNAGMRGVVKVLPAGTPLGNNETTGTTKSSAVAKSLSLLALVPLVMM